MAILTTAFNPSLIIRISSFVIGVVVLLGLITAGVTIAILATKTLVKKTVFQADMKVVIGRYLVYNELDAFFDAQETLHDLIDSLNEKFMLHFHNSCINFIVTSFPTKPQLVELIPDIPNTYDSNRPSIVPLNATIFFNQSYTAAEIRSALISFTRIIDLLSITGERSGHLGYISFQLSSFTDTYPSSLTEDDARKRRSINITITSNINITIPTPSPSPTSGNTNFTSTLTITTSDTTNFTSTSIITTSDTKNPTSTSTITTSPISITSTTDSINSTVEPGASCQFFVQAYLSVTFERYLANDETLIFDSLSAMLQDLTITIENRLTLQFSNSFIKFDALLDSDKPILMPNITTSATNNKTVTITLFGLAYFTQNQTSAAIQDAFTDCTESITLLNLNNQPSSASANFLPSIQFL